MEAGKESFGLQVHLAKKKSEPSKHFYYSESRLLMDYPLEKLMGMFLYKA